MPGKVTVDAFDAAGGPPIEVRSPDGFVAGPTDEGQYVVAYCGRHSRQRYPEWSRILWGTPLKDDGSQVWVHDPSARTGTRTARGSGWVPLSALTPVTRDDILDYHEELYGVRAVPSTWVFNDFGHATCYVFKDRDANRKLSPGETIHSEFFHTTPEDEAQTIRGLPVVLTESHGCIHLKPADIDTMRRRGYMARGNLVHVHNYTDKPPAESKRSGEPPFEIHFYPGARKIIVKGKAR